MVQKIVSCFEDELAKILGDKNSNMMLSMVLSELHKNEGDVTVSDVPLLWHSIEGNLIALLGISGVKVIEELLYNRLISEGYPVANQWKNNYQ